MNIDTLLEGLVAEHQRLLVPFIRKAYEAGYRDGLLTLPVPTSSGRAAPTSIEPDAIEPNTPSPQPTVVDAAPSTLFDDDPDAQMDEVDDEDDDAGSTIVRTSMTIGGLLRRIDRTFGLDRFNILVRIEDPGTHRHLKRGVRLSRFVKNA